MYIDNLTIAQKRGLLRISDPKNAPAEIVSYVLENNLLVCDQGRAYINCSTHLQLCKPEELPDLIYDLIQADQASQIPSRTVDESIKRILRHPSLRVDMETEREKTAHLVNMQNGVYDIEAGKYSENRGGCRFDYVLGFNYDPNVRIELARSFMRFIESSLGQAYLPCLLRVLGYCVSSLIKARKAFLLLGKGATGKSTTLELIENVVGDLHCSHVPFHSIGNIHSRAEYLGKRINISRDNSDQPMKSEDAFKSLVSCEMLTGRRLYENAVDFIPRLKLIFASNVELNFAHADDAVFDRLLVIPFVREIPPEKRDMGLLQKLLNERDIIFSAALNTLPDLVKSGYDFREPDECKRIIERYRAALHTADSFIQECCKADENGSVSSVLLFRRYCVWCSENGVDPDGQKTFYSRVRAFSPSIRDGKVWHNGSRVNGFRGLSLGQIEEPEAGTDTSSREIRPEAKMS